MGLCGREMDVLAAVWRCWDSWARHHQASQLSVPSPGQGNTSWPTQSRDQGVSRDQEDTALHTEQSIRDTSTYYIPNTYTGCPVKLFPLSYLLFCRLLLMQIAKAGTFLKNLGNLLHDRHKNFENRIRNSRDN